VKPKGKKGNVRAKDNSIISHNLYSERLFIFQMKIQLMERESSFLFGQWQMESDWKISWLVASFHLLGFSSAKLFLANP